MFTIVIDTNVFVSAIIGRNSPPAEILTYWQQGKFEIVSCPKALNELDEVLSRPHLVAKYPIFASQRETIIQLIKERAIEVACDTIRGVVVNDPDDDIFVAGAVEGKAKYVISGNKHLLQLRRYERIRMISPTHFVKLMRRCELMAS